MAGAVELAVAYVSIVAEASRLGPSVRRGLAGVEVEGRKAGTATGQEFTRGADTATNLAGVTRKVTESKGAAAKASGQYEQAIRREKDTSATLGVAEARLSELRASGTAKASQILRAEQAVERARAANVTAQQGVTRAYGQQFSAHSRLMGSTTQLAGVQGKLTGSSTLLASNTDKAANSFASLGRSQAPVAGALGAVAGAQGKAAGSAQALSAAQTKMTGSAAPLAAAQGKVASVLGATALAQDKTAGSAGQLIASQGRVGSALSAVSTMQSKAAGGFNTLGDASGRAASKTGIVAGAFSRMGIDADTSAGAIARAKQQLSGVLNMPVPPILTQYGPMLKAGLVAGLGAAAVSSVNLEKTFSTTMRQVQSAAQVPAADMKRLNDLAVKLGSDTAFSAGEAAEAMLALAKAGVQPATIEAGALSAALTQAGASGDSLEESANAIGNALNMFSLKGEDAAKVAAAFAGGANASTAEISDLTLGLSQVGPGAADAGHSLNDVVGVLSAFNNAGLRGSDAGTSLKTMLASLVPNSEKASGVMEELGLMTRDLDAQLRFLADNGMPNVARDTDSVNAAFEQLARSMLGPGASAEQIDKQFGVLIDGAAPLQNAFFNANGEMKSMTEIAGLLQTATKDMSDEQRIAAMTTLFGSDASRAAALMAKEGAAGIEKYIAATKDQAAAQDMANARMGGTAGAIEKLSGAWETFRLQIGQAIAPAVVVAADSLSAVLGAVSEHMGTIVPLTVAAGTAFGTYKGVMLAAAAASKVAALWTQRQAIAQLALNAAMSLNPIGLAIAAVAGLAAGLVALYKHNETFRNSVDKVASVIGGALSGAFRAVTGWVSDAGEAFGRLGGLIGDALGTVKDRIASAFSGMSGGVITAQFLPALNNLRTAVSDAFDAIRDKVQFAMTVVGAVVGHTFAPAVAVAKTAAATFASVAVPAFAAVRDAVTTFGDVLASLGRVVGTALTGVVQVVGKTIGGALVGVFRTAADGVTAVFRGLVTAVSGVLNTLASVIRGDWAKAWQGVQQTTSGLIGAVVGAVKVAFAPLVGAVSGAVGAAQNAVAGFASALGSAFASAGAAVKTWIGTVLPIFTTVQTWFTRTLPAAATVMQTMLSAAWTAVVSAVTAAWSRLAGSVMTPVQTWFTRTLPAAAATLRTMVTTAWTALSGAVTSTWSRLVAAVMTPVQTWFTRTIPAAAAALRSTVSAAWSALTSTVTSLFGRLRTAVLTPVQTWFTRTLPAAASTLRSMVTAAWSALTSTVSSLFGRLRTAVLTPVQTWFTRTLPAAASTLRSLVTSAWSALTSSVTGTFNRMRAAVLTPLQGWFTRTLTAAASTMRSLVSSAWSAMGSSISRVYSGTIKPAMDRLRSIVGSVPQWFSAARSAVTRTWGNLASAITGPINAAKSSINRNLSDKMNYVLGKVGVSFRIPALASGGVWQAPGKVIRAARGTVLPGYTPGRDVHMFTSPTGGRLALSGGEAVMVPEFVRAVGTKTVHMLNRMARSGGVRKVRELLSQPMAAHARGGIIGRPSGLGTSSATGRGTSRFAGGGVLDGIKDAASAITAALQDPSGAVRKYGQQLLGLLPGGQAIAELVRGFGGKLVGGVVEKVKKEVTALLGGVFSRGGKWPPAIAGRVSANTAAAVAFGRATWGLRNIGTLGQRANKSDHPMGKAADFMIPGWTGQAGISKGNQVANWFVANPGRFGTKYVIWRRQINSGSGWRRYTHPLNRTDPTSLHMDHVHVSFLKKGGIVGPDTPKLFDQGGMLRKGDLAFHAANRPDRVLTERQWKTVERYLPVREDGTITAARAVGNGDVHFHGPVYQEDPDALARAIERRRRDQMALLVTAGV